jgi:hypothetical protein
MRSNELLVALLLRYDARVPQITTPLQYLPRKIAQVLAPYVPDLQKLLQRPAPTPHAEATDFVLVPSEPASTPAAAVNALTVSYGPAALDAEHRRAAKQFFEARCPSCALCEEPMWALHVNGADVGTLEWVRGALCERHHPSSNRWQIPAARRVDDRDTGRDVARHHVPAQPRRPAHGHRGAGGRCVSLVYMVLTNKPSQVYHAGAPGHRALTMTLRRRQASPTGPEAACSGPRWPSGRGTTASTTERGGRADAPGCAAAR